MILRAVKDAALRFLLACCAAACAAIMLFAAGFVLQRGISALLKGIAPASGVSLWGEWLPAHLSNTVTICAASAAIALPIGAVCAVYLLLYGTPKAAAFIKAVLSALSAVPSAVFGLFGFFVFSQLLSMRYCIAAGILTMAVMLLSTAACGCLTAFKRVEGGLLNASRALGATEAETVKGVLLPCAKKGLRFAAVMCAAKAAGEAAALIFTCGTGFLDSVGTIGEYLFSSGATLAVGIYQAVLDGELELAFAACTVLMIMMLLCDALTGGISGEESDD